MRLLILALTSLFVFGCTTFPKAADFQQAMQTCESAKTQFHQTSGNPEPATGITAIKTVAPDYPKVALRNHVEGCVAIAYDLDQSGTPTNVRVLAEEPANQWFRESALNAFSEEEYPKVTAKNQTVLIKFEAPRQSAKFETNTMKEKVYGPGLSAY